VELATAGHWYASLTFWTVTGPIVAILSTLAIVWVTIRVANPKRRLMVAMPVITPLLNRVAAKTGNIEVTRDGKLLSNPRVVELKLYTRGRNDIPRSAFDGGRPVRLDIGTPIIQCLNVTTQPADRTMPEPTVDGTALLIQPTLIGKRQTTTYTLLTDGPRPNLCKPEQTLTDVDIEQRDPGDPLTGAQVALSVMAVLCVAALVGTAWIASTSTSAVTSVMAAVVVGAGIVAVTLTQVTKRG